MKHLRFGSAGISPCQASLNDLAFVSQVYYCHFKTLARQRVGGIFAGRQEVACKATPNHNIRRIRSTQFSGRFASTHSQIRMTFHPVARSFRVIR